MSEPFENNQSAPDPVPAQPPTSQPAQPEHDLRGSEQPVPASPAPHPPAGKRRGSWHYTSPAARARMPCRPTDLPPPVRHYDACGRGSAASPALAGAPPAGPGPTHYTARPAVSPGAWAYCWLLRENAPPG
jgi:hypothetical protein